ncbi:hypothetical protein [Anaplasma phagocytophilum]|uniref:hypothetical protein n=1 Tax=Anaplasma phagocytophilum TaxID=948 RepID=UPI000AF6CA27|nr:hypothetical protein [Anaplasma phagocytophilum]
MYTLRNYMLLQRDWVCCWFISLYVGKEFSFRGGNESSVTSLGMLWKGKSAYFMSVNKS